MGRSLIQSDAPGSPTTVILSGTGIDTIPPGLASIP